MNADRIIFEAPLHKNFRSLATALKIDTGKLKRILDEQDSIGLVRDVFKWVRLESPDGRRKSRVPDLTGQIIGDFIIVGRASNWVDGRGKLYAAWNCKCDCGTEFVVRGTHLKKTTACEDCQAIKKKNPEWQKKWRAA